MNAIFEFCEAWENCENEALQSLFERKEIEGNNFNWPNKRELIKLNEICASCKHSLKIEEKKCPICGNENLNPPKIIISGETAGIKIYNYRCEHCDRVLYSHNKFIL